ncbi:MAG: LCP family protein [Propionibacteriaceae bacterium]|nr:LCP family protein [Propionibacteriaceae bacterium]
MPDINDGERQADLDWLYSASARLTPPPQVAVPRRSAPDPATTPSDPQPVPAAPAHRGVTQADFDWLYKGSAAAPPVVAPFTPVKPAASTPEPQANNYADADFDEADYADADYAGTDYDDEEPAPAPAKPKAAKSKAAKGKKPLSHRQKILRRTLIVLLVIMAMIVGVGVYFVVKWAGNICSTTNGQCSLSDLLHAGEAALGGNPNLVPLKTDSNGRTNILLMGTSDDRTDTGGGDWLTDSIIIVSVSATDDNAFMISIPRDLWVNYPKGCYWGSSGKVNEVFSCTPLSSKTTQAQFQVALNNSIPTFEKITGLDIQYAVDLNYAVLESLTNAVGGDITVDLYPSSPKGIYDINTGLKLVPNGPRCPGASTTPMVCDLSTDLVMALARARNGDGGYGLDSGNFSREQNQQAIIVGILNQAKSNGLLTNLAGVNTALQGFGDNLRTTFSVTEYPTLMSLAQNIPSANIKTLDFVNAKPALVTTSTINDLSVVVPVAGTFSYLAIQKWIAKQMSADPAVLEGATIDVLNATGTPGKAQTAATALQNLGFTTGNVANYSTKVTGTQVYDITSKDPNTSAALAKQYGVTVNPGPVPGYTPSSTTDFVVIIGT